MRYAVGNRRRIHDQTVAWQHPILDSTYAGWTYFTGGDGDLEASWNRENTRAIPILSRPGKLGWTAPAFIPALNRYLLVSWYVTPTLKKWFEPELVVYDFYEAPHPWGPWTFVSSFDDSFLAKGQLEVFLDGQSRGTINLKQDSFPRLTQITVFSEQGLRAGPHTLKHLNRTAAWVTVDAFIVTGGATSQSLPPVPTQSQLPSHELEFYGFYRFWHFLLQFGHHKIRSDADLK